MASASQVVNDDPRWAGFRPKLAKWLCLCENYPYRMSFLVLVITDLVQKALVNRLRQNHPSRLKLVHYCKDGDEVISPASLELPEHTPIVEAYFKNVERYIYSHKMARKMLSLDGDPVRGEGAAYAHTDCAGHNATVSLRRNYLPHCSCNLWRI